MNQPKPRLELVREHFVHYGTPGFTLPISLAPTLMLSGLDKQTMASVMGLSVREITALALWSKEVLVSRAREQGLVHPEWTPRFDNVRGALRALEGEMRRPLTWLYSQHEMDERKHVLFILSVMKRTHHVQADHCS